MRGEPISAGKGAFFLAAALVVLADQASKYAVSSLLARGQSWPPEGFIRLTHVTNTGSAFGLFQNQTVPLIITAAIGAAAILLFFLHLPQTQLGATLGLGLQLGGALGNLVDRVRLGQVTDFIDLRVWPIFNLADSAIVVGVAILLYYLVLARPREQPQAPP